MPERTVKAAIDAYRSRQQRLLSCVTPKILVVPRHPRSPEELAELLLNRGEPVPLHGPGRLQLRVRLRVRLLQAEGPGRGWEAQTAAYEYALSDGDGREIVAYHWHPEGRSHARQPHLHLGHGAEVGHPRLASAHLPTGPVSAGDVVGLAIGELGADPIRRDWPAVFDVDG